MKTFEGVHCTMRIERPAEGVVLVTIAGTDVGELGDAPFHELARDLASGQPELFIDARETRGASIDVSGAWAVWLARNRDHLARVTMLTGSRFVEVTADFVRRFAELGETMRITTDPGAFDDAVGEALGREHGESGEGGEGSGRHL